MQARGGLVNTNTPRGSSYPLAASVLHSAYGVARVGSYHSAINSERPSSQANNYPGRPATLPPTSFQPPRTLVTATSSHAGSSHSHPNYSHTGAHVIPPNAFQVGNAIEPARAERTSKVEDVCEISNELVTIWSSDIVHNAEVNRGQKFQIISMTNILLVKWFPNRRLNK